MGKTNRCSKKTLRAAPLPLIYEAGDLRYTKRGNYPANPQGEIPKESDGAGSRTLTFSIAGTSKSMPQIGLGVASHGQLLTEKAIDRFAETFETQAATVESAR